MSKMVSLAREAKLIRSGLPLNELVERSKLVDRLNKQFGEAKNDIKRFERVSKDASREAKKTSKELFSYRKQIGKDLKRFASDINKNTKGVQEAFKRVKDGYDKINKPFERLTKGLDKYVSAAGIGFGLAGVAISFMALKSSERNQAAFDRQVNVFQIDMSKQLGLLQQLKSRIDKTNKRTDVLEKEADLVSDAVKRARSIADAAKKQANDITYEARVRLKKINDAVAQANSNATKAIKENITIRKDLSKAASDIKTIDVKATKAGTEASTARAGNKLVDSKATIAQKLANEAKVGNKLVDSKATTALTTAQQLPAKIPAIVTPIVQKQIAPIQAKNTTQDTEITALKARVTALQNVPKTNTPTTNKPATNAPQVNQAQINQAIVNSGIPARLTAAEITANTALKQSTAALNKPLTNPTDSTALKLGTDNSAKIDQLNREIQQFKTPNLLEPRVTKLEQQQKVNNKVNDQVVQKIDAQQALITAGVIAGLTPAMQQLFNKNNQNLLEQLPDKTATAVQNAPCSGKGCGGRTASRVDDLAGDLGSLRQQVNSLPTALNTVNAGANAAQLGLLNTINSKLGSPVAGGIGGLLSKIVKSSAVDKALQVMTFIGVIHNAYFLSANLAQSLFSLSSSAINATLRTMGVTTADDTPIDVGQIINGQVEGLIKQAIGVENWNEVKKDLASINRIYQSAANVIWTVQSIADSARNISEYIAENTGKIGNALKRFRVIGERAFPDMAERVNGGTALQRKYDNLAEGISQTTEGLSMMDSAFQEVISINDSVAELQKQKQEFRKSIEESSLLERPANTAAKARRDEEKAASKAPVTIAEVERTPAELEVEAA